MANQGTTNSQAAKPAPATPPANAAKPSARLNTRVGYCGNNVGQVAADTDDRLATLLIFAGVLNYALHAGLAEPALHAVGSRHA